MISITELIIIGMAAYRLWTIWLYTEITRSLRERMVHRGGKIGYLATCPFCISVWMGTIATSLWALGPIGQFFDIALAAGLLVFAWQEAMDLTVSISKKHQAQTQETHMQMIDMQRNGRESVKRG